ncbi:MAG: radical SAM protein [Faecalimonas sp.]|nr:radical SAM protein [Faecalimonas sp.]
MQKRKQTEPYLATYFHTKGVRLGLPIAGNFELTARCNFNCPMCYVHMNEQQLRESGKRELTTEEWISIAEDAKNKGMIFVLLTGGEPFVRKDFFEIYGAMKKMGLMVSINSNGSMLEGTVLEKLLADPPFRMNISLYGGCNDTYQNMCGVPMFDKVVNNIRTLKQHGIDVSINLSITPYNCKDIARIYEVANELEVPVKASSYMYPSIRVNGEQYGCNDRLSPTESAEWSVEWDLLRFTEEDFQMRAKNMANLVKVDETECSIDIEEGVKCRAGRSSFWLTWDGVMRPCGMMPGPNVYPLEVGFDKAWETLLAVTKQITTSAKCSNCEKKEVCGVCAAVCMAETGQFNGTPSYMCERTEEIIRITKERAM